MSRLYRTALGLTAAVAAMPVTLLAQRTSPARSIPPTCTPAHLPPAEKAAIEREYAEMKREDGQAKADAWLREEARVLLARLADAGVCTLASPGKSQGATPPRATTRKAPAGKDGKPCKRTRMENRAVANVAGGPMMMVLVPVCAD